MSCTRQWSPRVNLRQSLQVGAWNVLSLREDDHLSLLSSELKRLNIGIAALSETRRTDSGEIMVSGYTFYWSSHSDVYHAQRVAVAGYNQLTSMIIEVTLYKESILRLRTRHALGVISLVSVSAPSVASDLTVKDAFYATLESVVDECPRRDTPLVLGDFNASIGTDRDGYETCVVPMGLKLCTRIALSSLIFFQVVVDLGWLVYGFSAHRLIAGLGIPTLVMWQRRLSMCSIGAGG